MPFDLPPLTEAARDPDRYIPQLEEMQQGAKDRLRGISGALRELRKIKASTEHLEYIQTHGVPRPRDPGHDAASDESDTDDLGDGEDGTGLSRREKVLRLLAQTPEREWKVRDIAAALGVRNIKSLRTSMDDFARSGVVEKNLANSTYFLGRKGYQETF
jgi:hypothetical protein